MRAILAALFVVAALVILGVLVASLQLTERFPAPIVFVACGGVMILVVVAVLFLFNPRGTRFVGGKGLEEQLLELEQRGMLTEQRFRATRAFGVEELEDEGMHYYLELADGAGVLFLSGQYLYDYEPQGKRPDQVRRFPCSEFVVRRHKDEGYAVDVRCGGRVLEPDAMAPGFNLDAWQNDRVPADGTILSNVSYEDIKRTRLNA